LELVRTLADPIAGRVIVAHPDLAPGIAGGSASNFLGGGPDDLRIVTADFAALIGSVVVIARLRRPVADDLCRGSERAFNFKKVLSI
jgi:hypothetical protein